MSVHPARRLEASRTLAPSELGRFVELNAALQVTVPSSSRRDALRRIAAAVCRSLDDPPALVAGLPGEIGAAMERFGWMWNGFYVLDGEGRLQLGPAHGPPVCSPLEAHGGALSSGMCFDALLLNQTLAAYDVASWPGYVSCDAASGLTTVSGIVCPVRDPSGRPFAVWDVDSVQRVEPGDVRFFDVLLSSLARCLSLGPEVFHGA